ncbi:plasmid replication protein, CyRepA1 family [Okeania sp. SIO2B3]|uniref:plasmid replication protein, CyRepA1 family n=1 Tax=Okeania sp. SIO2B3 TaxID=2607784 RepID=UPI0013BF9616|nr:plasmid replication protein, CyRepA1 family [Okeania sp. SIO2B3]NET46492.1 DUF3854 domain-containing protein [Okeania sp. SIO2B3]
MINQTHFQEWTTESAVHPEIVKLNVQSFSKHEDWSPDCKLFDFLTPNPKRTNSGRLDAGGLRKYDKCLDSSGWGVNGIDPQTWDEMEWGRFKPDPDSLLAQPYLSKKTGQLEEAAKYLSPSGVPSRAVFLRSPDWTWETIARRYNVPITPEDRLRPGGFWQWVQNNSEVPIILEEGSKKAGCLLSLRYAAIGLPGIWMGRKYTNPITKFGEHLIPDLALFACPGRPVTILFDNDAKLKTKINVYKAIIATAKLLSKSGCKVTVAMLPDVENGKNAVDDFVVAGGDIDPIIENAIDWKDYRENCKPWEKWRQWRNPSTPEKQKAETERLARWFQQRAEKFKKWWRETRKFTPTITQNQKYTEYEDEIPDGSLVGIKANTGTGKTTLLQGKFQGPTIDRLNDLFDEGGQFYNNKGIMIAARNGLLLQNAKRLGFNHLQSEKCFYLLHEETSKIALCPDSLPHYLDPKWFDGAVVVLDEVMETIRHLLHSKTLNANRSNCLRLWGECLKRAKVIICLDANLADWALDDYIIKYAGYRKVIKVENQYKGDRAPVELLVGTSNNKSRMPENMEKPLREKGLNSRDISPYMPMIMSSGLPFITVDSQKKAEAIDWILTHICGKKGLRVDSKTIAEKYGQARKFMTDPDGWIKANLPEFIVVSPTVQSGIDINIRDYFTDVYGLFFGIVGTNTQMQMAGRVRDPNVQWHIACPEYSKTNNENFSSPEANEVIETLKDYLLQDAATVTKDLPELFKYIETLVEQNIADNPHYDAWAKLKAIENYEKANLRECLIEILTEAGHEVKLVELKHDDEGAKILSEASETVVRDESRDIFKALDKSPEEVKELLAKFDATWPDRCEIIKAGYKDRLPGIENSTIWSEELIYLFRKQRDFISQSELYYFLYHPEHIEEQQQELWGYLALGGMKFLGDVRSRHLKIKALEKLNIKYFLESDRLWTCHDPEIKQLLTKARRSKSISAALGITPGKDAIKYLKQVLNLIGYEVRLEKREAAGNRYYKFAPAKGSKKVALDFELVRTILSKCLAQKYDPIAAASDKSSNSKWEEAKAVLNLTSPENKVQTESEQMSDGLFSINDIGGNDIKTKLDLYQPPPDTPLGDLTLYEDYLPDFAKDLEILIAAPPVQQPDLTPIEAFKHKVQTFGWNVIKEAAKLSEALASKVIGFVEQLIDSGEWHFAPG